MIDDVSFQTELNFIEQKTEIKNINLILSNIKFCFLKYSDFHPNTNPIILNDDKYILNKFHDTILESIGFINIIEICNITVKYFEQE